MSKRTNRSDNNSKKTVNELLGCPVDEGLDTEVFETEGPQFFDMPDNDEDEETTYSTVFSAVPYQSVEAVASAAAPDLVLEPTQQERTPYAAESAVAADMEIMGNVSPSSSMAISGRIIGSVVCRNSVLIGGEVNGDISTTEMEIWGSVSGNITVASEVTICNGAQVRSDVIAHEAIADGTSEDDIKAEGKVILQIPSVIMGNVYAKTFEMSAGIKIEGLVKAYD